MDSLDKDKIDQLEKEGDIQKLYQIRHDLSTLLTQVQNAITDVVFNKK